MIREVFMPALSSTMTEGKIVSWTKSPGDKIEKGETVLIVESDKADMDVESFYEGYLATIIVPAGESAPVGSAIGLLAETKEEIEKAKQSIKAPIAKPTTIQATPVEPVLVSTPAINKHDNGRVAVSPRAKKLAKELGVDLSLIKGSGPYGRIIAEDIELAAGKVSSTEVITPPPVITKPIAPITTPTITNQDKLIPLNTLQNAVVRNMVSSLNVPSFRVGYTITTDALDQLYKQIKSKGVTMTALLAKAVALTLQKHSKINACYTDQGIQYRPNINIAIAVAMDDGGLITPVLQNADSMDIYSLSRSWKDLVERARNKQLQPIEYNSGTFTISNLGMFGVDRFDAILPPGQGAILAIGASRSQVVATPEGLIGVQKMMQVNLTADHRVIYGADSASFLQDLAKLIETNPQTLTL